MGGGAGRGLDFGATYGSGRLPLGHNIELEPSTQANPATVRPSAREHFLDEAKTDKVKKLVKELYHTDSGIGDGGTADAIRHELATGENVGGRSHITKGRERLRQIEKMLKKDPNSPDADLLRYFKRELENALGGK